MNPSSLTGRVALVTGATKNIGLAIAREFAQAGADLVITARTRDRLESVADELRGLGSGRVLPVAGDIGVAADVDDLAAAALAEFDGVDIVVNNALVDMGHQTLFETPPETWDNGLRSYIRSPVQLVKSLHPAMASRGHGSVINLVSTAAFMPVASLGAYGVMKASMWAMTRYMASELAPHVRVNALCPGTTSETASAGDNARWNAVLPFVPLKRMATPDETARSALYLASDMSSYTTGQVIFVDGGRVGLFGAYDTP